VVAVALGVVAIWVVALEAVALEAVALEAVAVEVVALEVVALGAMIGSHQRSSTTRSFFSLFRGVIAINNLNSTAKAFPGPTLVR